MGKTLLTTREAAALLGVGTTSIKRWADTGLLQCVKTPGGHRRFPRVAVEAMAAGEGTPGDGEHDLWLERWMSLLLELPEPGALRRALDNSRQSAGSWWRFADDLGRVLDEIGRRWATGDITVIQEHLASERLARTLAHIATDIEVPNDAPTCLLIAAEGDDHTLGLNLAEVCLREEGWRPFWAGRRTPLHLIYEHLAAGYAGMVAASASVYSKDAGALADQARRLGEACRTHDTPLLLGGRGAWPDHPDYGVRIYRFADLRAIGDDLLANARRTRD